MTSPTPSSAGIPPSSLPLHQARQSGPPSLPRFFPLSLWHPAYSTRQATYDLRRLRRKALITRLPHSHRYQLTPLGRRVGVLFTKAHGRVLAPGLALLDPTLPSDVAQ